MRESPAIDIIQSLLSKGAKVRAYDPEAMEEAKHILGDITYCKDAYDCADGADILCVVTEWDKFKALDFEHLKGLLNANIFVDFRNVYVPEDVRAYGFTYVSVGRA